MSFSPSQREAIKRAYDILSEHFTTVVVHVAAETENDKGERQDTTRLFWSGSYHAAVGLAHLTARDIMSESGELSEVDPL